MRALVAASLLAVAVGSDDRELKVAIVGGGIAGTATALELLTRRQVTNITIFEHGPSLGHIKSASGIIAAVLPFASVHKYWDQNIPFLKGQNFFSMRPDVLHPRTARFAVEWLYARLFDSRTNPEVQERFFAESRLRLEKLVDTFPELCAAIVGPFCCRKGSEARRWMDSNSDRYNVSCSRVSGIAHVFRGRSYAICNAWEASRQGMEAFFADRTAQRTCIPTTAAHNSSISMLQFEEYMRQHLFGVLWQEKDEGFVRAEEFFPAAERIFKQRNVTVATSCNVRVIEPDTSNDAAGKQPLMRVQTSFPCRDGIGGHFHKVIVTAGANTPNLVHHDRRISSQLLPIKGFAVKSDEPFFNQTEQIGVEYEDLGHYIRPQANGGVRYGYGRQIGLFEDQLLDPEFDGGWKNGTGLHATRLGRKVLSAEHVGLAGFRPLSCYSKFPLIKRYTKQWSGLLVNTGFGFYGYGMAWKAAEIAADLALGEHPEKWPDAWEDAEGCPVCTRGTVQWLVAFTVCVLLSGLFVLVTYQREIWNFVSRSEPDFLALDAAEELADSGLLDQEDIMAIVAQPPLDTDTRLARYRRLIADFIHMNITRQQFDEARRAARGEIVQVPADQRPTNVPVAMQAEEKKALLQLVEVGLAFCVVHCVSGLIAYGLAWMDYTSIVLALMVVKVLWVARLDFSQDELALNPLHMQGRSRRIELSCFSLLQSMINSADQELDGMNAGQAMLQLHSVDQSQVGWARSRYGQQWQCTQWIGPCMAWIGPYRALTVHFLLVTLVQCSWAISHLLRARNELMKQDLTITQWNEFWRSCAHGFDLCGLCNARDVAEAHCNSLSQAIRATHLRQEGERTPAFHGRYGRIATFGLKVILESGGSLILLTTYAAVTMDILTTGQALNAGFSIFISTLTIVSSIRFQLKYHDDIKANMVGRYGLSGFVVQRCSIVGLAWILVVTSFKVGGMLRFCKDHVWDMNYGCLEFSSVELYEPTASCGRSILPLTRMCAFAGLVYFLYFRSWGKNLGLALGDIFLLLRQCFEAWMERARMECADHQQLLEMGTGRPGQLRR